MKYRKIKRENNMGRQIKIQHKRIITDQTQEDKMVSNTRLKGNKIKVKILEDKMGKTWVDKTRV